MQHALRAFTAKDRKAIKLTAQNYPDTDYYDTAEVLTALGTGEALVKFVSREFGKNKKNKLYDLSFYLLEQNDLNRLGSAAKIYKKRYLHH